MSDKLTRIALVRLVAVLERPFLLSLTACFCDPHQVNPDRCKPKKCRQECKKSCPVVRMGEQLCKRRAAQMERES